MSSFDEIEFEIVGAVSPVSERELVLAEQQLKCSLPLYYRRFVTEFGTGWFAEVAIDVLSPARIVRYVSEDRKRLQEYWFWDGSPDVWTQSKALESLACLDGDGHDIRFHPDDPSTIYFLSHDDAMITSFNSFSDLIRFRMKFNGAEETKLTFEPLKPNKTL